MPARLVGPTDGAADRLGGATGEWGARRDGDVDASRGRMVVSDGKDATVPNEIAEAATSSPAAGWAATVAPETVAETARITSVPTARRWWRHRRGDHTRAWAGLDPGPGCPSWRRSFPGVAIAKESHVGLGYRRR